MSVIVAIGAHFDDIEAGCGGTLFKHYANNDLIYYIITNSDDDLGGSPIVRVEEQYRALNYIGINLSYLRCFTEEYTIDDIVRLVDEISPTTIYAPFEFDTHQDHIRAARVGISVSRKKNRTLLSYHSGSSYNFVPNLFSRIDMDKKEALLGLFVSQVNTGRIHINSIKKRNGYMSTFISCDDMYAEGFYCNRMELKI